MEILNKLLDTEKVGIIEKDSILKVILYFILYFSSNKTIEFFLIANSVYLSPFIEELIFSQGSK